MEGRFSYNPDHARDGLTLMNEPARAAFGDAYRAGRATGFEHQLTGHPLLQLDALIDLAKQMPTDLVEYNLGNIEVSQPDETLIPKNGLTIEDTIRNIEQCGSWACLHNIEIIPQYRALLDQCLNDIYPDIHPVTGDLWKPEAYVFISSPTAVTPFHFDPQYNILMQLQGRKDFYVYPADNELLVPNTAHENYHVTGLANLPYDKTIAEPVAQCVPMGPGQSVYVPLKAPHWVQTGPEVSISYSITWRSEDSDRQRRVYRVNDRLRKMGLNPPRFGKAPVNDKVKGIAYRVYEKMGMSRR